MCIMLLSKNIHKKEGLMTENYIQDALQFFVNLFDNLRNGILFFGGAYEIFLAVLDIAITTFVIYFILKLIRDSRAWQLLKGIVLIVIFSQIFILMGLQTIGYILTNTLSVLAIAFVVLFQPELRRALETVGRNSFTLLSGVVAQDTPIGKNAMYSIIDAIVRATENLAKTGTGALIIIERDTKLGEIAEQDNAVLIDSAVSSTLLLQIFYKGSPLHDGAVLIRNGRVHAARCHVPLSDNYQLRKDFGTRHRAAIGVSEMGDAIAIVVSEERSVISIAIYGRLYTLDNADALRTILHKQLDKSQQGGVISNIIKGKKKKKKESNINNCKADSHTETVSVSAKKANIINDEIEDSSLKINPVIEVIGRKNKFTDYFGDANKNTSSKRRKKILMIIASFFISLFVWIYVQIAINPVDTKSFNIPVTVDGSAALLENNLKVESFDKTVNITVKGRVKNLSNLNSEDIIALVDVSDFDTVTTKALPIIIKIRKLSYFQTSDINPANITVKIIDSSNNK